MSKYKDKKPSMIEFTRKYANNDQACEDFFFHAKCPNSYYCEKCGCPLQKDFYAIMYIPAQNVVICHVCMQE